MRIRAGRDTIFWFFLSFGLFSDANSLGLSHFLGKLQRAATARAADGKRNVQILAVVYQGRMRVMIK